MFDLVLFFENNRKIQNISIFQKKLKKKENEKRKIGLEN